MRWEDERYVKVYTRDTTDWLALSWKAQGLLCLILRKVDKAGILEVGKHGTRGLAAHLGGPAAWAEIEPALEELLTDGCVEFRGDHIVVPNFIEAQEACQSDAARQRSKRERDRDFARAGADVTNRDGSSQNVTVCHAPSRAVTPIPSHPSDPKEKIPAAAGTEPEGSGSFVEPAPPEPAHRSPRSKPAPSSPGTTLALLSIDGPKAPSAAQVAKQIFDVYLIGWHTHIGGPRPPGLDERRREKIAARLRNFEPGDLEDAARGIWLSQWHLNEKQTAFDLVIKNSANVERFRELAVAARGGGHMNKSPQDPARGSIADRIKALRAVTPEGV